MTSTFEGIVSKELHIYFIILDVPSFGFLELFDQLAAELWLWLGRRACGLEVTSQLPTPFATNEIVALKLQNQTVSVFFLWHERNWVTSDTESTQNSHFRKVTSISRKRDLL